MLKIKGQSVFGGVAIGPLFIFKRGEIVPERYTVADKEAEVQRFRKARETAIEQLKELFNKAVKQVGEDNAAIFEVHQMMLEDTDYIEAVEGSIRIQQINAEYAVRETADNLSHMFTNMTDIYMQARATDVRDISNRVLRILENKAEYEFDGFDKMIIAAEDLVPSETVQLNKEQVIGFVTSGGSTNSHTAILARTIGIPAVVSTGEQIDIGYNGKLSIIDGFRGIVYIDPDEKTLEFMQKKQRDDEEHKKLLQELKGVKSVTRDGHAVEVFANIANLGDLTNVMQNDAEGIGLFRSEFIYLESKNYPTEEQQFSAYKMVVETMAGKKVVIRTLDIGADKQVDYFNLDKEANPAMGLRAIRICLRRPEIFKTQLRALCRASAFGKLAVMFPMIISVDEVRRSKALVAEVQEELNAAGIAYDKNMEIGIMIETPAAAIMSDELAKEVDFFSIGTNDLSQYTMAIDRQNQNLSTFFDCYHPALLRLIATTVKNGHDAGIWVGICGELGADLELTETFLRMGVDELSVSPALVLPLRLNILSLDLLKKSSTTENCFITEKCNM